MLAARLNVAPETLSRLLQGFRKKALIEGRRGRLALKDPNGLCRAVNLPDGFPGINIILFCFAGAFANSGGINEMLLIVPLAIFAYELNLLGFSVIPTMLGLILGPIIELNFNPRHDRCRRRYPDLLQSTDQPDDSRTVPGIHDSDSAYERAARSRRRVTATGIRSH